MHFTTLVLWLAAALAWVAPAWPQEAAPKPAPAPPRQMCAIPLLNMKPPQGRATRPDPMIITPPAVPPDRNQVIVPAPPCDDENRPKDANTKKPEDGARIVHPAVGNTSHRDWFCILAPCAGGSPGVNHPPR